ncbi:DUF732 domain-containing protein [Streptomyces canus]|uniref:DUF732 domain-containing protein n=1 Tax=Streptomyces canus TaxID=58343 RepID=UPI0036C4E448
MRRITTAGAVIAAAALALTGCSSDDDTYPGPISSEAGHTYSPAQDAYLGGVRDLDWPAGATEKDALFAALSVCAEERNGLNDVPWLTHKTMDDFGLNADDAGTVVMAADVAFCTQLNDTTAQTN